MSKEELPVLWGKCLYEVGIIIIISQMEFVKGNLYVLFGSENGTFSNSLHSWQYYKPLESQSAMLWEH